MLREVKRPELGEEIESAVVLSVLVKPGDHVARDQPLIELETEKTTTEVPCPIEGVIEEVLVREGDEIRIGQTMLAVREEPESREEPPGHEGEAAEAKNGERENGEREARAPEKAAQRGEPAVPAFEPAGAARLLAASPSLRRFARELGVDLSGVTGTGEAGRVTEDDVKTFVRERLLEAGARRIEDDEEIMTLARFGKTERRAMSRLRRATAHSLARSWARIPRITQFDDAELGAFDTFLRQERARAEKRGVRLTLTSVLIKISALALRRFPGVNAAVDSRAKELVLLDYVHVGVAVDTEHGLLVPVIRDADEKPLAHVARELQDLVERAKQRKLQPGELEGASLTISNLGPLGTTYFTPMVTWPQVAVVGAGKAEVRPVWCDGAFRPRRVLPLSMSYDHRAIDGADAARFLRWIAEGITSPLHLIH